MKTDIANAAHYLWKKGWAEAGSGNISVRAHGRIRNAYNHLQARVMPGLSAYITTTGSRFRHINADDVGYCWVGADGETFGYDLEDAKPSSELISHLLIHEALEKTDDKCIIHIHATNVIALSMVEKDEKKINETLNQLIEVPIFIPSGFGLLPFLPSGSVELAQASAAKIKEGRRVLIWPRHGLVVVSKDLETGIDIVEATEKSAEIALKILACKRP
jgi:ribulose-5-phosphate 4-epimerase/fuculose-1-phosphate aldolase